MTGPGISPGLRRFALTAHVIFSVGWLGAVAAFLALAIAGLNSKDTQIVRAAYLSMQVIAWFVIVPFAFASLLTGIVESLTTTWGFFRHYWVLSKLVTAVLATIVLCVKMKLIGSAAIQAAETTLSPTDLRAAGMQLAVHAGGGLLVLFMITTISVFKPWGRTRYGRRQQEELLENTGLTGVSAQVPAKDQVSRKNTRPMSTRPPLPKPNNEQTARILPARMKVFTFIIGGVTLLGFVVWHLIGHSLHGH